ncbi:MAG: glycosyltransferase family 1 protein [Candidatus Sungiibacteriota bacterium]
MKIGIVLHPYGEDKPAGLARTIFEFTKALIAHDPDNEYIIFLKKKPRVAPDLPGRNWRVVVLGDGLLWLERLRHAPAADIYVFNTPVMPLWWRPRRSVVLALDFAYKYFPPADIAGRIRNRLMEWYHGRSLRRADRIITMSEATKKDVLRFFHIPEVKVTAVHWGFKKICDIAFETADVPADFFLFIGVMKERKNVLNVVRGFREFSRHNARHALVLCGKGEGEYAQKLRDYIRDEGIGGRVVFPGYLTEGQVAYLYQHATALVFPSFVEGFGFPVLEAMDCGTPVITSNCSSLAELGADGVAILVDPHQPKEIAEAMTALADDAELRANFIRRGRARAAEVVWERRAPHFLKAITS